MADIWTITSGRDKPSGRPFVTRNPLILLLLVVSAANLNAVSAETVETCTFDNFHASCETGEIIMTTSAEFGRMRVGKCIAENEFIGCTNNVLPIVDRWCSGQQSCHFEVEDLEPENTACLRSLMKYLEASYTCMAVESRCSQRGPNILTKDRGHLSNQISCGSPKPHWIIRAQVGQIINMSLIDFAASDKVESFITCKYVYGYILERALGINHTICGGKHREGALYSSKTNNVEIFMLASSSEKAFVISFEIIGCPDLKRPQNTWYKRQGNEAVIGCETNDQEWRLTCTGNTWQGRVGNCTNVPRVAVVASSKEKEKKQINMSSIVMMTGFVGGALVLIVVVIVIAVVYLQKYRMKKQTAHMEKTYATMGRHGQRPVTAGPGVDPRTTGTMQLTNHSENLQLTGANMMSYPTKWTCATLPNNEARNDPLIELGDEKEALYNSLK